MSSKAAVLNESAENLWGGGKEPMKASYGKLMMWFFLVSDAFTFAGLLTAYGMIRASFPGYPSLTERPDIFIPSEAYWPVPEEVFTAVPFLHGIHAPLVFVAIMSFILILSSVTMVLAVEAGHRRHKKDVEKWMIWTIIGGFTFLGCQAWEWAHFIHGSGGEGMAIQVLKDGEWVSELFKGANLAHNEYGPQAFGQLFFFITGFHGFHVFSGLLLLIIIFYNVTIGTYEKRGHYEMVEKVGLYWHFVDLVWVFVFTLFYLI